MKDFKLGLELLRRALRAGELTLLALALALAVASLATVSLFTDRTRLALEREANRLLGADLVFTSSRPIPRSFADEARSHGLAAISTLSFRSMVTRGEGSQLAEVTAVEAGYPLRGTTRIARERADRDEIPRGIPPSGTLWGDERLVAQLAVRVGDRVVLGERQFELGAMLTQDPSLTLSVMGLGPRLVMALADVESTGLVSAGSRVVHRLLIAGESQGIEAYRTWAAGQLPSGVRLEGVRDARPEVRSALERAERFMGLAALVAVALAAVAIMLAVRRFNERQLDVCAMLRCLGVGQQRVFRLQLIQLAGVGVIASACGCLVGYLGQSVLGLWLSSLVGVALPEPSGASILRCAAIGVALLLAFGLPPLLGLSRVPALRVLRRELGRVGVPGVIGYALGGIAVSALVLLHAGDMRLGLYILSGCVATVLGAAAFTWIALRFLTVASRAGALSWRFGVANLRRRAASTIWQVVALALGLTALLTLTSVRSDLLGAWQANLPADAPNRFLVNIPPDHVTAIDELLRARLGSSPVFYPMVRGRLVEVNGAAIDPASYGDDRARRLVEREFNLSWGENLPAHNQVTSGAWHGSRGSTHRALSVEEGIARTLGLKLGDRLTYDVAGQRFEAPITSLRKVAWDSFRVNFFVIGSTALLADYPATHITSFHLAPERSSVLHELVQRYPAVVAIDVAALMTQVKTMIEQVARAVTFVFVFTLAAGVLVLYAGIVATHDERVREVAIMRTLGATRGQVLRGHAAEFAAIGALAGALAASGASGLAYVVATRVLSLPYQISVSLWAIGIAVGMCGVVAAGLWFTRRVLATAPLASLRQLA